MATFKDRLKDHLLVIILGILAAIATILQLIFQVFPPGNKPAQKDKEETVSNLHPGSPLDTVNKISSVQHKNIADPIQPKKQQADPPAFVNSSIKADFAVMAITNGQRDAGLANIFINWLKNSGTASQSILQNTFIKEGYFNKVVDGDAALIKKINISPSAKYVCLARYNIKYTKSDLNPGLILSEGLCEVMIIRTADAEIIDAFKISKKSSGISEDMARQRLEEDIIAEIAGKRISL